MRRDRSYTRAITLLCLTHPAVARHAPPDQHPERPARIPAAPAGVRGVVPDVVERLAEPASAEALERVHPSRYLEALDAACSTGGWIDSDTWVQPESKLAYRLASGGAVGAVEAVLGGEVDAAI